ncbi:tetraacyldisaccharide 4'-kinase [Ferrimonas balearica]|uniref:tetraacyldisaccharide 4'-kinase n=1 Tax=Ferrimonas balearica TaxID=44012 RepID=UPI001C5AA252|nr:tetraacyldisaccharide 4'-kinase [Ferrimonas balearica]MBW3166325.1 tetraacyldisaccharide 4'-kinase [Ferrimonas balearica]
MSKALERAWQQGHPALYLLAPLTALFALISVSRRWLYRRGWLSSPRLSVPVVVVGNISVGGNGKTPTVLYLVALLQKAGYRPGIISRGYGGKAPHYPYRVDADTPAEYCGDEPALMAQRTGVPVAVGPDRVAAAQLLIDSGEVDVLISDDGMQHYRLARQLEVAVIDGQRRFGNGWLLPMGPLRETPARLQQCDLRVCNGGEAQPGEYAMTLMPDQWQRVDGSGPAEPPAPQVAMAGIGHPPRFFDTLRSLGMAPVACHGFADHQPYKAEILTQLTDTGQSLVMTEKDAVKCRGFARSNWYYLPVTASLGRNFDTEFLRKLKESLDGL